MAPKRRPQNVVRSGNAGNSTKPSATKAKEELPTDGPPRPPPLFPPGYKPPLSMLNEKCQKAGWEKPLVDTVRLSTVLEESHANRRAADELETESGQQSSDFYWLGDATEASQQERL